MTLSRRQLLRMASGLAAATVASSMTTFRSMAEGVGTPSFLSGHFRPVDTEATAFDLPVRGAIPKALSGRYFRNGHNPQNGENPGAWFYGAGMIHGLRIAGGHAEWYRNRWIRTPALEGAPLFREDGSMDLTASTAATSVIAHAGRILALQEVNLPFEVTPELETLGVHDFNGALETMMTAHPRVDPRTGELLFFGNSPLPPFLTYHVADANGRLTHSEVIEGPAGSVIHDFAITENYVIWFDPNVTLDLGSGLHFPYTWNDRYPGRIGILPRDRSKGDIIWIDVDPYYVLHFTNAWENADGTITVECPHFDKASWSAASAFIEGVSGHGSLPVQGSRRSRWTIDLAARTARSEIKDETTIEFPKINDAFTGRANRYAYAVSFPGPGQQTCGLVKYDMHSDRVDRLVLPEGVYAGEPCFVPDPEGQAEDDGWLLSFVTDLRANIGELWIIDARDIRKPVASIEIPVWTPAGVHGSWIDDSAI
ncbi:carotenoid oxygenase family protein [Paracoccus sp. PAMC 22219]|uniref:carotenoid oxygenase family protein n=1 Tax=Paracoccus sp. PAMC 22219 TaxID=1569209 RepID=UPI0018CD7B58|nr:carotenoid oxygenase family protein [Paracoccus sp. PAMC 22219]